jgi:hypothetical protein
MAEQNNHKATNFWFGFSVGVLSCSLVIYLFGTKAGRKTLKNLLDVTEDLVEGNLNDFLEELEKEKEPVKKISSTISPVIDKVKSFTP